MENNILFSGDVAIKIQGSRVLKLMPQNQVSTDFQIVGFENIILIKDLREGTRDSIKQAERNNDPHMITRQFNQPANILVNYTKSNKLHITLTDSLEENLEFMMWINVGLKGSLPIYDYIFHRIIPLESENEFALFALFRRSSFGRGILPAQVALADDIQLQSNSINV